MEIFERISKRGKSKDRILFVLESKKGRKAKSKNRTKMGKVSCQRKKKKLY